MSQHLSDVRLAAALASGGISSKPIYDAISRVLLERQACGRLLDLGSGQGNLIRRLSASDRFETLTAADIIARPAGLPDEIAYVRADMDSSIPLDSHSFDTIVCAEVIEHLENPRLLLREISRLLAPGGLALVTTPNCENIRSLLCLLIRGYHWAFGPGFYPAHLTALTRLDLERCFTEAGLTELSWAYTGHGGIPGMSHITWQMVSFGTLSGRWFSDNVVISGRANRPHSL